MNLERSCGAVVFARINGEARFLILTEMQGAHSFPKGHMEGDETETQTALREIREETGLTPALLPGFRAEDEYDLAEKPGTRKHVTYFLAEYDGGPVTPRPGEIREAQLLPYAQACQLIGHTGGRRVLEKAFEFIRQLPEKKG